jgi:hypothetical protein
MLFLQSELQPELPEQIPDERDLREKPADEDKCSSGNESPAHGRLEG